MSNPDFPGPSWQDRAGFPEGAAYRGGPDAGYGPPPGWDDRSARDDGLAGSVGNGYPGNAYGENAYGGNGYGSLGDGQIGGGPGADDLAGVGVGAGTGADDIGRGFGYRGKGGRGTAGKRPGRGAGRPGLAGGRGGPGRQRGGRRASALLQPNGRPAPVPGNWLQRQWHARWWRHWTLKKVAFLTGGIAVGMALVLVAGFFYVYSAVALPLQALSSPLQQSSVVYFADGHTEIGCFCSVNRTVLTEAQLGQNKYLEQAFFAAEDRNFLTEGGISVTGTARALLADLAGSGTQGGSTITEEFVKTYLDPCDCGNLTYKQKIKEIVIAVKLAKAKSKQWILSHYLNAIYLGAGAYGVQAAAETYFGRPAWKLSIGQSAMLAAMVQAPSAFTPSAPTQNVGYLGYSLLDRWIYVLDNMVRDNAITQQQMDALVPYANPSTPQAVSADLKHFPKLTGNQSAYSWSGYRGYIMMDVLNELENVYHYTQSQIDSGGLRIFTTISKRKMDALYSAVNEAKGMMRGSGQPLPWYAHIGAVLENPRTGAIEALYEGPKWESNPNTKYCKRYDCQYPMATLSRNQVGSSFKPYVLAAAVQEGMNVGTSVLNGYSPLCVPPETLAMTLSKRGPASSCPAQWAPVGYDPVVEGPVSVAKAAALSSNAAFEDLAHRVGTSQIIKLAQQFGVNISAGASGLSNDVGQVGIALGIAPLTVEEQATTFATLADNGVYHTPHMIAKISQGNQSVPLKMISGQVLTQPQVADVDWALSFDTVYGTGYPNAVLSPARPTIAKTGTTDVAQSAFFIGALPQQYSLAVGMFTNSQNNQKGGQTLDILPSVGGTGGGYGGAWPAKIWQLYMTKLIAMANPPVSQLAPLQLNGFTKWVQAHPVKKKPKCKQGPRGHGHGHKPFGPVPCPSGSPGPGPGPSGPPSPSPTPGPTSFSPNPTPTGTPSYGPPSPSPSKGFPVQHRSRPPAKAPAPASAAALGLTAVATLPRLHRRRSARAAEVTGLT